MSQRIRVIEKVSFSHRLQYAISSGKFRTPPVLSCRGDLYPWFMDEHALLATNIKKYIDDNAIKFIMGNKSLSSDWDAYVSGLNSLKLDLYLENIQKAIDNSK